MNIVTAYIITFVASFCMLVIEIVAGRILAPFVGVSLYTWTSIIGVVSEANSASSPPTPWKPTGTWSTPCQRLPAWSVP